MTWIASHTTIGSNPKTRKLARRLEVSIPEAIGILHLLWHFGIDYAKDGDLSKHDPEDIAEDIAAATHFEGDPQKLLDELQACGWVDDDLKVNNWHDIAGRLIEHWAKDAERKRKERRRERPKDVRGTSSGREADVRGTSSAQTDSTDRSTDRPTSPTADDGAVVEKVQRALEAEGHDHEAIEFACARLQDEINTNDRRITSPIAWARTIVEGRPPKRPEVECPRCKTKSSAALIEGNDGPVCRKCYEGERAAQ